MSELLNEPNTVQRNVFLNWKSVLHVLLYQQPPDDSTDMEEKRVKGLKTKVWFPQGDTQAQSQSLSSEKYIELSQFFCS